MKVVLSPASRRDIREIALYIAARHPRRARSFGAELRAHCHAVGKAPLAYPLVPELGENVRYARGMEPISFYIEPARIWSAYTG